MAILLNAVMVGKVAESVFYLGLGGIAVQRQDCDVTIHFYHWYPHIIIIIIFNHHNNRKPTSSGWNGWQDKKKLPG